MINLLLTMCMLLFQYTIPQHTGTGAVSIPAITFVALASGNLTTAPTPVTTSTTLNVSVGDKLIVFCKTGGGNNTLTVTDTSSDTFFGKGTHQNDGGIGNTDMFYAVASTANAAENFTCNSSNSASFSTIVALQYRGGVASSINDVLLNATGVSGAWTTTSFTTVQAEVIVQCMGSSPVASAAGTIGGVTATLRFSGTDSACQDHIFTNAQTSIDAVFVVPGSGGWNGQLGSFK
jgi:hypothetical protein